MFGLLLRFPLASLPFYKKINYHSMQVFLPFHWPRAHHVT